MATQRKITLKVDVQSEIPLTDEDKNAIKSALTGTRIRELRLSAAKAARGEESLALVDLVHEVGMEHEVPTKESI